mgnify:CR=1 FL=1
MIFKNLLAIVSFVLFISCDQYNINTAKINYKSEKKYKNAGFALIYNNDLVYSFGVQEKQSNFIDMVYYQ